MHWLHSIDQLIFHVGSNCHTTDEYYRVLHELLEDRQFAVVSAFAESKRNEGAIFQSAEVVKDKNENKNARLRAEATLVQTKSRTLIATPALDAARLEIWAILQLIELVEPLRNKQEPLPLANQTIQYAENILDLAWKAFVERKTFGALSAETTAQLLARGLEFNFDNVHSRDQLYGTVFQQLNVPYLNCMTPARLDDFAKTVKDRLPDCEPMRRCIATHASNYMEKLLDGTDISGLGFGRAGNQTPAKSIEG